MTQRVTVPCIMTIMRSGAWILACVLAVLVVACSSSSDQPTAPSATSASADQSLATASPAATQLPSPQQTGSAPSPRPLATPTPKVAPTTAPLSGFQMFLNGRSTWAPDGQHLLVSVQRAATSPWDTWVVSADGSTGAYQQGEFFAWFDSSTIASELVKGLNFETGPDRVDLLSLDGTLIAEHPYPNGPVVLGLGHVAGPPADGGANTFQIWDGKNVGDVLNGEPVTWSGDGSRLVVVHPRKGDYYVGPGDAGTVEILDAGGGSIARLGDWVAAASSQFEFSPDNRYVAIDYAVPAESTPGTSIIADLATGDVLKLDGEYGFSGWVDAETLYLDGLKGSISTWTPETGISRPLLQTNGHAALASDGSAALWRDGASRVAIRTALGRPAVDMPGTIGDVSWSPDGSHLAVVYDDPSAPSLTRRLAMLVAPDFQPPET